ncbi:hypothetical protein [Rhodococcus sp. JS3073]|uniref:hypothetical protein n=1 Tax=Rhodococcus sp. JS3073 TaxID=3002901 RepID=UPI0022869480|nr:hypothetical protein [Rhodococcus sp. JS3073]WAM19402.1 hypothetical protein OYT95_43800 [Rhodococcus sp. JS3073]
MTGKTSGNLPLDLSSFVGRRNDVAEVRRLVGASRLVTLCGMGGIGKSKVALRVATDAGHTFAEGVWLIDVDGHRDGHLFASRVADQLGIELESGGKALTELAEHLAPYTSCSSSTIVNTSSRPSPPAPQRCYARVRDYTFSAPAGNHWVCAAKSRIRFGHCLFQIGEAHLKNSATARQ